jgi:hypothetical protein
VRRELAAGSIAMLRPYRQGEEVASGCPLQRAIGRAAAAKEETVAALADDRSGSGMVQQP